MISSFRGIDICAPLRVTEIAAGTSSAVATSVPESRPVKQRGGNGIYAIMNSFKTFYNWCEKKGKTKKAVFFLYTIPSFAMPSIPLPVRVHPHVFPEVKQRINT